MEIKTENVKLVEKYLGITDMRRKERVFEIQNLKCLNRIAIR